jgi:hypothetical protein
MPAETHQFESKEQLEGLLRQHRSSVETRSACAAAPAVLATIAIAVAFKHTQHASNRFGCVMLVGLVLSFASSFILFRLLRTDPKLEGIACTKCGKSLANGFSEVRHGVSNKRVYTVLLNGHCPNCGIEVYPAGQAKEEAF